MLVSSFAFKKEPAIKDTSILNNKHFIFSFRARIIVWQLVMTELSVLAFPHIALSTVSNFMRFLFHLLLQDPLYKTRSVLIYRHFLFRIIMAITMSFMELPVLGLSHIVLNASQSLQDWCFIFCFGTRYKDRPIINYTYFIFRFRAHIIALQVTITIALFRFRAALSWQSQSHLRSYQSLHSLIQTCLRLKFYKFLASSFALGPPIKAKSILSYRHSIFCFMARIIVWHVTVTICPYTFIYTSNNV